MASPLWLRSAQPVVDQSEKAKAEDKLAMSKPGRKGRNSPKINKSTLIGTILVDDRSQDNASAINKASLDRRASQNRNLKKAEKRSKGNAQSCFFF